METKLSQQIRQFVSNNSPENSDELLLWAEKFDEASAGYFASNQTVDVKTFLGTFAKTRRLYCEASGEPLI